MRTPPPTIAGRVNADGTVSTGSGFTSRKTATGTYALTFPGWQRIQGITLTSATGGPRVVIGYGVVGNTLNVLSTVANTAVAQDDPFWVTAVGS